MAFCRLLVPLLVLSVVSSYASKVPVYMWGDLPVTGIKSNPLTTLSTPDFEEILKEELRDDPLTIVFIEETLSVEDFSRKDEDGQTAFSFLRENLRDAAYVPSVEDPLRALNLVGITAQVDRIKLTENGLAEEITPKTSVGQKFVFVTLEDAVEGETRSELLERHDSFMEKTIDDMKKRVGDDEKIVAIYTARYPSWTITHSRARREAVIANNTYELDNLKLYISSIDVTTTNNTFTLSGAPLTSSEYNETAQTVNATLKYDNTTITLNLYAKGGYWFFNSVLLELTSVAHVDDLYPIQDIYAADGFSYRCLPELHFRGVNSTKTYSVVFNDLKIQPFFNANGTGEFGDSFNCVGFFSAPIWAGLFVVFILLAITFYGIMMMMDIRTMDRFDDPKGKTITINASE